MPGDGPDGGVDHRVFPRVFRCVTWACMATGCPWRREERVESSRRQGRQSAGAEEWRKGSAHASARLGPLMEVAGGLIVLGSVGTPRTSRTLFAVGCEACCEASCEADFEATEVCFAVGCEACCEPSRDLFCFCLEVGCEACCGSWFASESPSPSRTLTGRMAQYFAGSGPLSSCLRNPLERSSTWSTLWRVEASY